MSFLQLGHEVKLVIFDMDGTMLDTEPIFLRGWKAAIQEQKLNISQELFENTFNSIVGTNRENCQRVINKMMPEFDIEKGYHFCDNYKQEYIAANGVPIKAGLFKLLDELESKGIKKCVATSTGRETATQKLQLANILHRFHTIVGGDEVSESKPSPEIFLKAAALCDTLPENCLVLEDSAAGTLGAYRAGMRVITIPDILPASDETRAIATAVVQSLDDVLPLIIAFGGKS